MNNINLQVSKAELKKQKKMPGNAEKKSKQDQE